MEAGESVLLIGRAIDELHNNLRGQPWERLHRAAFVAALEKAGDGLQSIYDFFSKASEQIEREPREGKPELQPFLKELQKLQQVLEKNLRLEKEKKSHAKEVNVLEKEETPELYADLEQRLLAILLKARYALERLSIFLRKEGMKPITDKSTAKQVMEVLRRKEDELQDLKERYEEVRKKSYLGYFEEGTTADLEQQLAGLGKSMALSANELGKNISLHRSQIEHIESSYAGIKQKLDALEEQFSQYSEKASELIKLLKKERDYAKKVVLEIEHETLQLRTAYTQEMLNLQESKVAAKREAERKHAAGLQRLQKALQEQTDLAKHFRKVAEDKLRKEQELEEKVKRLTLLCKTKEKHEAVKKLFKERGKMRKKRKKK